MSSLEQGRYLPQVLTSFDTLSYEVVGWDLLSSAQLITGLIDEDGLGTCPKVLNTMGKARTLSSRTESTIKPNRLASACNLDGEAGRPLG